MEHAPRTRFRLWRRPLLAVGFATVAAACQSSRLLSTARGGGIPWTSSLPSCPCEQPQPDVVGDGWAMDASSCTKKHPGASVCFRSYPTVKTNKGRSGQQCCYDQEGLLITSGSGAGTPDRESSCRGEKESGRMKVRLLGFLGHVVKDVRPWSSRLKSWQAYHADWPPNNSNNCSSYHVTQHKGGSRLEVRAEQSQAASSDHSSAEPQTEVSPR